MCMHHFGIKKLDFPSSFLEEVKVEDENVKYKYYVSKGRGIIK